LLPWAAEDAMSRMEKLSRQECLRLLATQAVGRLGVVSGIHPLIVPVNYALDGEAIVFRTDAGLKLDAAAGQPVAFEVDELDVERHAGWSVHVWGKASEITEFDTVALRERVHALALVPWAPGDKTHWVRITAVSIEGRRLTAA
jgi:uncharacterized protein